MGWRSWARAKKIHQLCKSYSTTSCYHLQKIWNFKIMFSKEQFVFQNKTCKAVLLRREHFFTMPTYLLIFHLILDTKVFLPALMIPFCIYGCLLQIAKSGVLTLILKSLSSIVCSGSSKVKEFGLVFHSENKSAFVIDQITLSTFGI